LLVRRDLSAKRGLIRDALLRARSSLRPFDFQVDRYRDHAGFFPFDFFLQRDAPIPDAPPQNVVPRVVYSCWMGTNKMSPDRLAAYRSFARVNPELEHILVTRENVSGFIVAGHPLHPSFDHLSDVHKSDYLRCYLLHFHGGAYTDVKAPTSPWRDVFDRVDSDPDAWLVGYPESTSEIASNLHGPLGRDLQRHHARLAGNCAFIVRAQTPLTREWYDELLRRMDYHQRDLAQFPALDPFGTNRGYPVTWIGLQGLVLLPLQLKHLRHVRVDRRLTPSFEHFR
jgi:hypothetical protein